MADRTIPNLRADDWFTIAGMGRVASIDTEQVPGPPIVVGDYVRIDNVHYEVLRIETTRILSQPPQPAPNTGFLVRRAPYRCGTCRQRYATIGEHHCPPQAGRSCDLVLADSCGLCGRTFMPGQHSCA